MIRFIRRLYFKIVPTYRRLELRRTTWSEANHLIETTGLWTIAKEEDDNHVLGVVFIERRERIFE